MILQIQQTVSSCLPHGCQLCLLRLQSPFPRQIQAFLTLAQVMGKSFACHGCGWHCHWLCYNALYPYLIALVLTGEPVLAKVRLQSAVFEDLHDHG